jgi:3-carboxy-cis,cis-muconate cycloisomerase
MTSSRLIDSLATTDVLAALFSDASVLQAMIDFEVALARAAARAGAIPEQAADGIARAARVEGLDAAAIARDARHSATPSIPFVNALRDQVRAVDSGSAQFLHWGATSQDVSDTALVLLLKRAHVILARDHTRLEVALAQLSDAHATTVMLGRTLLQPATPITFGLKAAGWYAAVSRSWSRLSQAWDDAAVVQFGGAAGTRAAAGEHADAIASALAAQLGLAPAPPWHTDRDRLGALITALGLYTAALGKIARDVALLMQAEVAEVFEAGGGSSTLPHKRNPSGCAVVLAAATRMPGLVAAFLFGMLQEHERSVGGSQAEWSTVASGVQTAGGAVAAMATVIEDLTVDSARMRANIDATHGVVFAERALMLLTPKMGRDAAQQVVTTAIEATRATGRSFGEVLRKTPAASDVLTAEDLLGIDEPERYLGTAEALRKQLLDRVPLGRTE